MHCGNSHNTEPTIFPAAGPTPLAYTFPSSTFHHQTASPLSAPHLGQRLQERSIGKGNRAGSLTQFSGGSRNVTSTCFVYIFSVTRGQLLNLIKSIFPRKISQDLNPVQEAPIHGAPVQMERITPPPLVDGISPNRSKHELALRVSFTILSPHPTALQEANHRSSC